MNNPENESLFDGYNLPPYVKDVIIRGFSISNDKVNKDGLKAYLTKAIPRDMTQLKARLMVEKSVHVLVRFVITSDLKTGKVKVNIPDAGMNDGVFVDETLLALDASTGQNALSQAKEFSKITPLTGLILTKIDGTAKGGVVLAIRQELDIPVKFIGFGEKIDDIGEFDSEDFIRGLLEGII